jgi:tetratricopeptide (TPR) repeat protein
MERGREGRMSNPASTLEYIQVASRRSAVLVLVGTIVVVASFTISAHQAAREANRARAYARQAEEEASRVRELRSQSKELSVQVAGLREALSASRLAIAAFHQGDYATALTYYNEALRADPNNAYLLNLRAYALFKRHRYEDALAEEVLSVRADPTYAWGYFDLARFQCALGKRDDARRSIAKALSLDLRLRDIMRTDGEFRRLCGSIVP